MTGQNDTEAHKPSNAGQIGCAIVPKTEVANFLKNTKYHCQKNYCNAPHLGMPVRAFVVLKNVRGESHQLELQCPVRDPDQGRLERLDSSCFRSCMICFATPTSDAFFEHHFTSRCNVCRRECEFPLALASPCLAVTKRLGMAICFSQASLPRSECVSRKYAKFELTASLAPVEYNFRREKTSLALSYYHKHAVENWGCLNAERRSLFPNRSCNLTKMYLHLTGCSTKIYPWNRIIFSRFWNQILKNFDKSKPVNHLFSCNVYYWSISLSAIMSKERDVRIQTAASLHAGETSTAIKKITGASRKTTYNEKKTIGLWDRDWEKSWKW